MVSKHWCGSAACAAQQDHLSGGVSSLLQWPSHGRVATTVSATKYSRWAAENSWNAWSWGGNLERNLSISGLWVPLYWRVTLVNKDVGGRLRCCWKLWLKFFCGGHEKVTSVFFSLWIFLHDTYYFLQPRHHQSMRSNQSINTLQNRVLHANNNFFLMWSLRMFSVALLTCYALF